MSSVKKSLVLAYKALEIIISLSLLIDNDIIIHIPKYVFREYF
jgi:hypothetical protein